MNFKKFFATQTMVLGLGAALLFAGSARAQAPTTAAYDQRGQVVQQTTAADSQDAATQEALAPLSGWAVAMLLIGMGICVYFVPKTVPMDRNSNFNMAEAKDRRWVGAQANRINTVASLQ